MIKIIYFITSLRVGGAEMMLFKLLSRIDRNQFEPAVISLSDIGSIAQLIKKLGISVYAIGMDRGRPNIRAIYRMIYICRRFRPDIIHGWMYHGNIAAQISAAFSFRRFPVLWNIRQSLYSLQYEKRATAAVIGVCSYLSRYARHIVYNSEISAEQHEAIGYKKNKRVLIPNGFDTEVFKPSPEAHKKVREELNIPGDSLIIGLVGRYHHMKDHLNFIQAAGKIIKRYPSTQFILAGHQVSPLNRSLWNHIKDLNLVQQMHLIGERSDIPRIMAAFDISSSSSYAESFPNVVGEAMACGVPCAVTDVGDSARLVGDTGRVVPPGDSEALANALAQLIETGSIGRKDLGIRARQRIIENFSLNAVAKRYERLYFDVLGKENN